ncbi:MAG: carboxypeptidase-like regulatory domain-containing protein [Bacteroidaceae bacterium]|nr:carboxypeptidase-like regulatory domain-containing protein [Bacteroidaceae bacterium]
MRLVLLRLYILCVAWLGCASCLYSQIRGTVRDTLSNAPLQFIQVYYEGTTVGTLTDEKGYYSLPSPTGNKRVDLVFSSLEYVRKTVSLKPGEARTVNMKLRENSYELLELTVKPKREKYSRKNNPAVEMIRKVIANKKNNSLKNHDFYSYEGYQKLTMSLDDITPEKMESGIFKSMPFLKDQVEVDGNTHRMILPVSVEENVTRHLYRKNPEAEKSIVLGKQASGVNDLLSVGEGLNVILKDFFGKIDIYKDDINLLEKRFISPIASNGAISFYKYYIMDTIRVEQDTCYHLTFVPQNSQDIGFTGHLYIMADSSYQVKKCTMSLPKESGVNFVEEMDVLQEFQQMPDGGWGLKTDDIRLSIYLMQALQGFQIQRITRYSNYSFEELDESLFKRKVKEEVHADAQIQDEEFWAKHRQVQLTRKEDDMGKFVDNIKNIPGFKYIIIGLQALIENFIETGSEGKPSKFDIGPVNTVVSSNYIDGMRFRLSGKTTAALNPHLFFNGYVAYGTKDSRFKYKGELEYSFNKKKRMPFEFPRRSVAISHQYDVMSPSDKFLATDKDNMFLSVKSNTVDQMSLMRKTILRYQYETDNYFSTKIELRHINDQPVGKLAYLRNDGTELNAIHDITTSEVAINVRYAPGETYVHSKQGRVPVNHNAPVFSLTHTMGFKGIAGGDYNFHSTELSIYKRFWLASYGRIDTYLQGGIQWSKVPFPLLFVPAANQSYILQRNTFNLLNNMEFLNDRYASLDITCELNGVLFNRIPLLKKLKWREVFGFKALYGSLSDKNNPYARPGDAELFQFPHRDGQATSFVMDSKVPYMEYHVGIHNIFKLLQIEYVRRINYLGLPDVNKHGIRFMVMMKF